MSKILLCFALTLAVFSSHASEVVRIDTGIVEDFQPFTHKYEIIIEENCAYCLKQISIFNECLKAEDVAILLDNRSNKNEEELKKILKKKKIGFKTYMLNKDLKNTYAYKGVTPSVWINKSPGSNKFSTGVASCEYLLKNI